MSSVVGNRPARRAISEETALRNLVERLGRRFPQLAEEDIVRVVNGRYAAFANSRVRDFVPVLVERAVCRDLDAAGGPLLGS